MVLWGERRYVHVLWQAFPIHLDSGYAVEAQQRKVGKVFLTEGFSTEMGVDVTDPRQPPGRRSGSLALGQEDLLCISNDDLQYVAPAIDQDSELPAYFPGDLRQIAGELRSTYFGEGNASPVDTLDSLVLIGLEPKGVTKYLLYGSSPGIFFVTH
jgi:hypothetical protein